MTTPTVSTTAGAKDPKTDETQTVWKKRAEHLVQHLPTGTFYARLKIKGKTIRKSLEIGRVHYRSSFVCLTR